MTELEDDDFAFSPEFFTLRSSEEQDRVSAEVLILGDKSLFFVEQAGGLSSRASSDAGYEKSQSFQRLSVETKPRFAHRQFSMRERRFLTLSAFSLICLLIVSLVLHSVVRHEMNSSQIELSFITVNSSSTGEDCSVSTSGILSMASGLNGNARLGESTLTLDGFALGSVAIGTVDFGQDREFALTKVQCQPQLVERILQASTLQLELCTQRDTEVELDSGLGTFLATGFFRTCQKAEMKGFDGKLQRFQLENVVIQDSGAFTASIAVSNPTRFDIQLAFRPDQELFSVDGVRVATAEFPPIQLDPFGTAQFSIQGQRISNQQLGTVVSISG